MIKKCNFEDVHEGILTQKENDDDESMPDIIPMGDDEESDYYDDDNVPDIVNLDINRVAGANDAFYNSASVRFLFLV